MLSRNSYSACSGDSARRTSSYIRMNSESCGFQPRGRRPDRLVFETVGLWDRVSVIRGPVNRAAAGPKAGAGNSRDEAGPLITPGRGGAGLPEKREHARSKRPRKSEPGCISRRTWSESLHDFGAGKEHAPEAMRVAGVVGAVGVVLVERNRIRHLLRFVSIWTAMPKTTEPRGGRYRRRRRIRPATAARRRRPRWCEWSAHAPGNRTGFRRRLAGTDGPVVSPRELR